mmetsp:Transcript_62580/g.159115  ORF Transcript_62580/g.159115 Transcript_62580/m.159115 type:complete len:308 (+) Transcript_62580:147-1070(+)
MQVLPELLSAIDVANKPLELLRGRIRLVEVRLVLVEPCLNGADLVYVDVRVVDCVREFRPEDVADLRVSRHVDLAPACPHTDRLFDVLPTPHVHAVVVLSGLVPPAPGDTEEAATHARHEVVPIVKPLEEEGPIEHHLDPDGIEVGLPCVAVQDRDQRHDHSLVVDVQVPQDGQGPVRLGLHVRIEEHDGVPDGHVSTLGLGLDQPSSLLVSQDPHLREVLQNRRQRRTASVVDDNDLLQDLGGSFLIDGLQSARHVLVLVEGRHHNRQGLDVLLGGGSQQAAKAMPGRLSSATGAAQAFSNLLPRR